MIKIENKTTEFSVTHRNQKIDDDGNIVSFTNVTSKDYFFLMLMALNTVPDGGFRNLEDMEDRSDIRRKIKAAQEKEANFIELEKAELKKLQAIVDPKMVKWASGSDDMIEFLQYVRDMKDPKDEKKK